MSVDNYPMIGRNSHPGQVREHNEDGYAVDRLPFGNLLLVADGMGGHRGGKRASGIAVETIRQVLARHSDTGFGPENIEAIQQALWNALAAANAQIFQEAQADPELAGMGTTAVMALVMHDFAYVAHVGDSRLYHVSREGLPAQVTKDHTTVQQLVDSGIISIPEARNHPEGHKLSRALGIGPEVEPDVRNSAIVLNQGEVLVLCSDGLSDLVDEDEIAEIATAYAAQEAADRLVGLANARGAPDNVTVIVYQTGKPKGKPLAAKISSRARRKYYGFPLFGWVAAALLLFAAIALGGILLSDGDSDVSDRSTDRTSQRSDDDSDRDRPKRPRRPHETQEDITDQDDDGDIWEYEDGYGYYDEGDAVEPGGDEDGGRTKSGGTIRVGSGRKPKMGKENAGTKKKKKKRKRDKRKKKKAKKGKKPKRRYSAVVNHGTCKTAAGTDEKQKKQIEAIRKVVEKGYTHLNAKDGAKAANSLDKAEKLLGMGATSKATRKACKATVKGLGKGVIGEYLFLTELAVYHAGNAEKPANRKKHCGTANKRAKDALKYGADADKVNKALGKCSEESEDGPVGI